MARKIPLPYSQVRRYHELESPVRDVTNSDRESDGKSDGKGDGKGDGFYTQNNKYTYEINTNKVNKKETLTN